MIEQLNIERFLTFEELNIPVLKQVNLIAGRNNAGKTALLEAIRIVASHGDNTVINNILHARDSFSEGLDESYLALFNREHYDADFLSINLIKIKKELPKNEFVIRVRGVPGLTTFKLNPYITADNPKDKLLFIPFKTDYQHLVNLWDNIALTPKEEDVLRILQETIEPDLVRFNVSSNGVKIRLKDTNQPIPLATLGDGVQRILLIALSLANASSLTK